MKNIKDFICGPICGSALFVGMPMAFAADNIYAGIACLICGLIFAVWYG